MASMNISLPDSMRKWVEEQIESGHYASVSDYVRDLIRHDQRAKEQEDQLLELRKAIVELRDGSLKPAEDVLTRLEQKYRKK